MTSPVRIPADVDMHDRVLAGLTARQVAILAVTGGVLYLLWTVTRAVVPIGVFLVVAIPVGVGAAILALGQRDGVSLDRLVLAAIRQRMSPRRRVAAPDGIHPAPEWLAQRTTTASTSGGVGEVAAAPLRLPAEGITDAGVVDLGTDGLAIVAAASTVNFALRTATEQEALVASFARYLHSLSAPVQILIRAERLDLSGQIAELRDHAPALPHPALEEAALEHADYLDQLREQTDLLRRQILLVLREPLRTAASGGGAGRSLNPIAPWRSRRSRTKKPEPNAGARRAAETRLVRRLSEATELLAPAGITVTPLAAGAATAVLGSACNPDSLLPPAAGLAGADEIITGPATGPSDPYPPKDSDLSSARRYDDAWDAAGFDDEFTDEE